jgi:hypothetical protein
VRDRMVANRARLVPLSCRSVAPARLGASAAATLIDLDLAIGDVAAQNFGDVPHGERLARQGLAVRNVCLGPRRAALRAGSPPGVGRVRNMVGKITRPRTPSLGPFCILSR